jgi:type IVB pilus formation R64 PilN family outer membrane protein
MRSSNPLTDLLVESITMKILRPFSLLSVTFIFLLTACVPQDYKNFSANVDKEQADLNTNYDQPKVKMDSRPSDLVLENSYSSAQQAWLNGVVTVHAKNMSFQNLANRLIQGTPIVNAFGGDINAGQTVSMDFKGSRKNALEALAALSGYAYTLEENVLNWSAVMTRTFDVSFMPGASKYLVGETNTSASTSSASSSGGGSGSGVTTSLGSYGEYSSIQGDLSIWKDLENTVKGMLTEKGKVNVSQATTTITVTDKPANVRNIQNYLVNMNQSLSRQVVLDVQVIEVTLNKSFNYGIDWNLVRSFVHSRYHATLSNNNSSQINAALDNSNTFLLSATGGIWNNTNTIINALATEGKVSVSTQPRVVTLNNQVAEIGINTQTTYLASVSTTITPQVGSTTALTPNTVTTGFTLYLLPKIQGDNVYLQITSTLANLVKLQKYDSKQGAVNASEPADSSGDVITAPVITQKRFNERAYVPSNATLVLAGFKQLRNEANKNSVLGQDALGGYGGNQDNVETIVLITPTIINSKG